MQRSSGRTWRHHERILHPLHRGSPFPGDLEGEGTLGGHRPGQSLVGPDGHLQVWRAADAGMTWTSQMPHSLEYCQDLKAKGWLTG